MDKNVFTIPSTIGPPNAKRAAESITVPHGQGVIIDMCARGYDGHPLPNPEDHDFYLAVSRSADGAPLEEWHIGDPQVSLIDPAMSKTRFRLRFADLAPYLQEGVSFRFDGWSQRIQPEMEDPVRHVQGTITLGPSILGRRQPFFDLTSVGFNDLLGAVSDNVYLVDLRTGFKGGQLPIAYSASAGGIVNDTLVLSREAVVSRTVTVTAIDGRNDQAMAVFQQITYAPLAFVDLADVVETQEANGTIDISLSVGFTGGYGNRVYEADRGTVSGSVLTLALDQVLAGAVTVIATDEDENVATGSFQFTVEEAAPVLTAPAKQNPPELSVLGPTSISVDHMDVDDGGSPITSRGLHYAIEDGAWVTGLQGVVDPTVVDGLPAGTRIRFRTRAVNDIGIGEWSDESEAFTDAAAYTPSITRSENMQMSVATTAPPAGEEKPVLLIAGSIASMTEGSLGNSFAWRSTDAAGTSEVRLNNSGGLLSQIGFATSTGTGVTVSGGGSSAAGDRNGFVVVVRKGVDIDVYRQVSGGAPFLIDSDSIASSVTVPGAGSTMVLLGDNRIIETSGIGVWELDAVPDILGNWRSFIDADGYSAGKDAASAALGAEPLIGEWGNAAAWADAAHDGSDPGAVTVSGAGAFSDVVLSTDPLVPANAELLSRLSIQPHRTGDILEGQPIDYRIEGLTEEEYKTWAFYWNMDDEGEAGFNPVQSNLPGIYSNPIMRTFPVGPTTTYAHRTPRARTLKVNVVPPVWSGIEGCQLTYAVDIKPLSHLYDSTNTWVVVPAGVTDPTEIAGTRVATLGEAWNAGEATATGDALIYLPGGETITPAAGSIGGRYDRDNARLYLTSYGTGKCMIDCTQENLEASHLACPLTWTIRNVAFDGGWDPVTADGAGRTPISHGRARTHLGLTDCLVQNANYGVKLDYNPSDETLMAFDRYSLMAFDTHFDNCLDYGIYVAKCQHIGLAGCTALWKKDMPRTKDKKDILGVNDYAIHGLGRFSFVKYVTLYNVSGFIDHGWFPATFADPAVAALNTGGAVQALFRAGSSGLFEGSRIHARRCYSEGQVISLDAGAKGGDEFPSCIAAHALYVLGSAATNTIMRFGHSGVSWANNFIVFPNSPAENANTYRAYDWGNVQDSEATPGLQDRPIALSRCATLYMRSQVDWSTSVLGDLTGENLTQSPLTTPIPINIDGGIAYAPNLSISGATTTGVTTAPWGPQPRKIGLFIEKLDETIFSDLQYATPANSAVTATFANPQTVAPTVDTPADDFWGKLRPATPTAGPIEASPLTGVFGPWVEPDTSPSNEAVV